MSLAEGVSARVVIKPYASGAMASNSKAVSASDLGDSGGQVLRRVSSTLKFEKDTYSSNEVASHRQISDFRHGMGRITGNVVAGEYSPGTYWDLFEAVLRGTAAAAVTASESDFTSCAADNTSSKFTFAGGNPHTKGLRVGSIFRFTSLSDTDNNGKNFLLIAMGGTSNRELTVYPAPDTMSADTAFSIAEIGQSLYMPSSGFVSRKFGIEHYFSDVDIGRLFTEVRLAGFNLQMPATGMAQVDFSGVGRDMEVYTGGSAPFFTAPAAETTTGLLAAVNGVLYLGGTRVGVCTGFNIQCALNPTTEPVVGQNYPPEVFLGRLNVTGQTTIMLEDATYWNAHKNETELSLLGFTTSSSDNASAATSVFLPRIKLGDADTPVQGEAGIIQTCPFQALKYATAGAGIEATTIRFHDTEAS